MTVRDAIELVIGDHRSQGNRDAGRTPKRAEHLLRHLDPNAERVELLDLMRYAQAREGEGASPATINRELAVLRRGLALADMPWPKRWKQRREAAPRQGFTSAEVVDRICVHLTPGYAAAARFLFLTGWRRNEALNLRWSEVDFERGEVRLLAGTTKNREPRVFPMYPQLRALLQQRAAHVGARAAAPGVWVTLEGRVFGYSDGSCFSRAFKRACVKAGVKPVLLHDFRRTAARNMIEAGVDRQVAMKLLGHKTESIFNRYRITTGKELENAAGKLSGFLGQGTGAACDAPGSPNT